MLLQVALTLYSIHHLFCIAPFRILPTFLTLWNNTKLLLLNVRIDIQLLTIEIKKKIQVLLSCSYYSLVKLTNYPIWSWWVTFLKGQGYQGWVACTPQVSKIKLYELEAMASILKARKNRLCLVLWSYKVGWNLILTHRWMYPEM